MPTGRAVPVHARWASAWRIEADPGPRLRQLRRLRMGAVLGSVLAGTVLVALLVAPGDLLRPLPVDAVYLVVGYLFALAPAVWFGLGWSIRRQPDRIAFDDEGVLVHLRSGEERGLSWEDPQFAVDLTNWGGSDFTRGTVVLESRNRDGFPVGLLSIDGVAALRSEALGRGLRVEARVEGKEPKTFGVVELRSPSLLSMTASAMPEGDDRTNGR
jgi:hypothetical protein